MRAKILLLLMLLVAGCSQPPEAMVNIPAGAFRMGSDQGEADERPAQEIELGEFWISPRPVTRAEFDRFLRESQYRGRAYSRKSEGRPDEPVVGVTWKAAAEYCRWAGGRLPTEAEWERAARGTDGRTYPWGEDPSRPAEPSPAGCYGMGGQIWEWTSSRYAAYPYRGDDGREDQQAPDARVIRGGARSDHPTWWRCSNRFRLYPNQDMEIAALTGFRLARGPAPRTTRDLLKRRGAPYFQLLSPEAPPLPTPEEDRKYRGTGYPYTLERELAYFIPMEHLADMAERSRRKRFAGLERLSELKPGQVVADIGTGSGAVLDTLSKAVGPKGKVWATDISISALRSIQGWTSTATVPPEEDFYWFQRPFPPPLPNVQLLLHDLTDCLLPESSLDVAYLGQVHYFYYPRAKPGVSAPLKQVVGFYASLARSLKPKGRLVILDWSERNPVVDPEHGNLTAAEVTDQMRRAGLRLVKHAEVKLTDEGPVESDGNGKLHSLFVFERAR